MIWDMWKQGFTAWEQATAQYMEKVLTNASVLGPAGAMLTAAMKTKAATDRAMSAWWAALGLPTVFVQEGGYDLPRLAPLVLDVLTAFESAPAPSPR